ncbi:hypothetical protein [Burkholderia anthina]|uniref:hypothetical protein n=1 Tax=Burkholderia anthina TaxID=179879 RepID=UPI0007C85F48|nr:hypothetical protein [Burkholderia anthina]
MSSIIKVAGLDPSMSNFGVALADLDVDSMELKVIDLILIETEPDQTKQVKKVSDDLRRAYEVREGMLKALQGRAHVAFSEIPLGSAAKYNNAIFNAGFVIGVLASCPIPIIEVFPMDVKMAAVGHRQAAKEEMIEWAVTKYPTAPWKTRTLRGKPVLTKSNEHLADAVAAIHAGIETRDFEQMIAMRRSLLAA